MATLTLSEIKQGEAKPIKLTIKKRGVLQDVSLAVFSFVLKENKDSAILISKADVDFDKTLATVGVVSVTLTTTDTSTGLGTFTDDLKIFICEFRIEFTAGTDVDKSIDLFLPVRRAVDC